MEFLLGGAIISGVTWLMNGGLDDESTASQERFEATARKSAPSGSVQSTQTKYRMVNINGKLTRVADFT